MPGAASRTPDQAVGFLGGVQAGYNWQNGPWVFGVEGDIQASGADDTFAPWKFSNPWFGTLRGRVGYAFNNVLFYGTGGLAFGELRAETFGLSESHTSAGWTVGVGAEVGFSPNWSAKVEYLYVDLSSSNFAITGVSNGYSSGVGARRRELSLLIAEEENTGQQPPGRSRPGFFFARCSLESAQDEMTKLTAFGPLPFLSGSTSKVMRCPSARSFSPARSTAVMCTKTSRPPSSGLMNP